MISRIKVPVEELYRFVGARALWCTNVRFIRLINIRGKKIEELISVLLNFRCYKDSVESSTM